MRVGHRNRQLEAQYISIYVYTHIDKSHLEFRHSRSYSSHSLCPGKRKMREPMSGGRGRWGLGGAASTHALYPHNHQPEPKPPTDKTNQFVGEQTPHPLHRTAKPGIPSPRIRTPPGAQLLNPPAPPQPLLLTNYPPTHPYQNHPTPKQLGCKHKIQKNTPSVPSPAAHHCTILHPHKPRNLPQPPNLASHRQTTWRRLAKPDEC